MTMSRKILSEAELAAYHRDGFVIPKYRLPADKVALLQRLAQALVDNNPDFTNSPMTAPHVPGSGSQKLKSSPEWMEVATYPDLLDIAEQIMGPDIILWGTTLFYKKARKGLETPWHQDHRHYPISPMATTTIWIAVTECTTANGCLRLIPGSHKVGEPMEHHITDDLTRFIQSSIPPDRIDESRAVDAVLQPGELVIFDAPIIHGASPNSGETARCGYALRLMPATSHYDHDDPGIADARHEKGAGQHLRPLILARGVDRSGLNDFKRAHPAAPNAGIEPQA